MNRTYLHRAGIVLAMLLLIAADPATARQATGDRAVVSVPISRDHWRIEGEDDAVRFEQYKGQSAVRIEGGAIALDDANFRNGTVEFDMAFPHVRGFHGIRFRFENEREYEHFYFRSHLSGMPDANQYQPITGGYAAWQLLHGEAYSSPTVYAEREWIHVRLVVQNDSAEVYIDSEDPEVTFRLLGRARSGGLALTASALNPVWYANFSYSRSDEDLRGTGVGLADLADGFVTEWDVSTPVAEAAVVGPDLDTGGIEGLGWRRLEAERNGAVNLARVIDEDVARGRDRDVTNTVIARLAIDSDRDRSSKVRFGYSDRVRVFLNGRLLYEGDNGYLTRDYRYLGTIGLFDAVQLPLREGENLLEFAVSEDFGGWGLMARFPDRDGMTFTRSTVR